MINVPKGLAPHEVDLYISAFKFCEKLIQEQNTDIGAAVTETTEKYSFIISDKELFAQFLFREITAYTEPSIGVVSPELDDKTWWSKLKKSEKFIPADSIVIDEASSHDDLVTITEITGWQIVNGGQTTASIYNAFQAKLPLEKVHVQIKLSVIKQKEQADGIIQNISKYANSQNKINMSDFNANDVYHVKMERLSRSTYIPVAKGKPTDQWFYERARGQYLVELSRQPTKAAKDQFKSRCPKNRCISKTVAAKCVMAWSGYPYIVSKGLETNFVFFSDMVSKGEFPEPSEQSYIEMISRVILFNRCDDIIKSLKFGGFKAQQDYYTVALIGKYYSDLINPQEIWNNQDINAETAKIIETLAYFVWEHFQNPSVPGVNIGQWCKKEDCWELLQKRFEAQKDKAGAR